MKSIVNYIKDGKEVRKKINILNYLKIDIALFKNNISIVNLEIKDDVDFLNFKNFSLTGIDVLSANRESLCILDHCFMNKSKYARSYLRFKEGSFQIINPDFFIKEIELDATKDVSMYFEKKDCYEIKSENSYWRGDCENIEIYSNYSVKRLNLNAIQVKLIGLFDLYRFDLFCNKKIIIGNNEQFTKIKLNNVYYSNRIDAKELILNNCLVINESDEVLFIDYEKISGNNFLIKSKGEVFINGNLFPKVKNEQGYVEITLEDIIRYNFVSTLAGIQKEVEVLVEENADELLPLEFGNHILIEINKLKEEKNVIQQKIVELENELKSEKEVKIKKLIKELKNESINNLDRK